MRPVAWLRFPLICCIVCVHSSLLIPCPWTQELPFFANFSHLFIYKFCDYAVPMFFFISGMLFFRERQFSKELYTAKLKRRLRTLLLPYVLWNVVYFLVVWLLQTLKPGFMLLLHKPVASFVPSDYLWLFWDIRQITGLPTDQAGPLVGQFWFLQCLMVAIVFSPLIWTAVRKLGFLFPAILFTIEVTGIVPEYPGFLLYTWIFFSLGACFSIKGIDAPRLVCRHSKAVCLLFLFLMVTELILHLNGIDNIYLTMMEQLSVMALFLLIASKCSERGRCLPAFLTGSTFFVFAVHRFFTALAVNVARSGVIPTDSEPTALAFLLASIALSIAASVALYQVCHKLTPNLCNILTGGRSA